MHPCTGGFLVVAKIALIPFGTGLRGHTQSAVTPLEAKPERWAGGTPAWQGQSFWWS